jgi:hypothetical protein
MLGWATPGRWRRPSPSSSRTARKCARLADRSCECRDAAWVFATEPKPFGTYKSHAVHNAW